MSDEGGGMQRQLEVATAVAREAGRMVLGSAAELEVDRKGGAELVTQVDFASQELITGRLLGAFPDHAILGEEGEDQALTSAENLWVIDPIDGTTNYVHGIPQYCISIAYAERGETLVGAVYDPERDEMFTAARGGGAFLNGHPIRVTRRSTLDTIVVATGFYYDRGELMERTLTTVRELFGCGIRGIRRFGSAALDLCWLACGRYDAYFEYRLSVWDFAAGALLVREAGGRCEDSAGLPLGLGSSSVVAANPALFGVFADTVRLR